MNGIRNLTVATVAALSLLVLFAVTPLAFGQGSSVQGYSGAGGQIQSSVGDPGTATAQVDSGSLPFTGMDLMLMAVGALVLLAAGIAVAYLAPRTRTSR